MKQRDNYIDLCRAGAMVLVVLHHCGIPRVGDYILSFHMPLLFMITGMTFHYSFSGSKCIGSYFRKRFQQLMIPYFLWEFITFMLTACFVLLHVGELRIDSVVQAFKSIILCLNIESYKDITGRLWFLPAATVSSCVVFVFLKGKDKLKKIDTGNIFLPVCAILVLGLAIAKYYLIDGRWPFTLDISLFSIFYIIVGYYVWNLLEIIRKKSVLLRVFLLIISIFLWLYGYKSCDAPFLMFINSYGNIYMALYTSIMGSLVFLLIMDLIRRVSVDLQNSKSIQWLNKNSIDIFPAHLQILKVIKRFTYISSSEIINCVLTVVSCFILLYFYISFVNAAKLFAKKDYKK